MIRISLFISLALIGIVFFQPISVAAGNDPAVDNLIANYVNNAYLASTLVNTAGQYVWDRNYDGAEKLYRAVVEIYPNNPYTTKARMGLARLDVLNLITEKKWSLAEQKVESMAVDFNSEPDLAVALFHIGKEFTWQHQYSEAKETFDILLKQPLNNSFLQEAKLWSARANVCSLIGKADDSEVIAATDKLLSDFASDAGLAEAVYWISREYEWKKSAGEDRAGWYDAPNSVFQRLIQKFGYTSFGQDAEWDQKRLTHRMKIFKLMQEPNQSAMDAAIEAMIIDLKDRTEVAGELRWIAWGYEEQPDKTQQAMQIYKRIISEYPGTIEANEAVLDMRRLDIWNVIKIGDANQAEILINNFVSDFNQHPYASPAIGGIAMNCYITAMELNSKGKTEEAKQYFERAVEIWKKAIEELPISSFATPDAWFFSGVCYSRLGLKNDAIRCYKEVSEKWPEYRFAREAERMAKSAKN